MLVVKVVTLVYMYILDHSFMIYENNQNGQYCNSSDEKNMQTKDPVFILDGHTLIRFCPNFDHCVAIFVAMVAI